MPAPLGQSIKKSEEKIVRVAVPLGGEGAQKGLLGCRPHSVSCPGRYVFIVQQFTKWFIFVFCC